MTKKISKGEMITSFIERNIRDGSWPPGYRIPYEYELAEQFGCSRMIVNKAVSQLAAAGKIERRKKAGSFVTRPSGNSVLLIPIMKKEVEAGGQTYGYSRLMQATKEAPEWFAEAHFGGEALYLEVMHLADGEPFCFEYRYLNLTAIPQARDADFSRIAPGTWLMEHIPWSESSHSISAINAPAELAAKLKIAPHDACLEIKRVTKWKQDEISVVWQTFAGNRCNVFTEFSPKAAAQDSAAQ